MNKTDKLLIMKLYRSLRNHNYQPHSARNLIGLFMGVGERKLINSLSVVGVLIKEKS